MKITLSSPGLHHLMWLYPYSVFLKAEAYKDLFQTSKITIVFTTFAGAARLEDMREWTQQELTATKEPRSIGNNFLFASFHNPLEPRQLLLEPCWYSPYDEVKSQPVTPGSLLAE